MEFTELRDEGSEVERMSTMAAAIVKEHYDPIIGEAQNDYMIERFQTPDAIRRQMADGSRYFFASIDGRDVGFLAFQERGEVLYLSKLYLYKEQRGKGYSRDMIGFLIRIARDSGASRIELNVNKGNPAIRAYESLGFEHVRDECNPIGGGFVMDDRVYAMEVK